jgi:hypothetical protein
MQRQGDRAKVYALLPWPLRPSAAMRMRPWRRQRQKLQMLQQPEPVKARAKEDTR